MDKHLSFRTTKIIVLTLIIFDTVTKSFFALPILKLRNNHLRCYSTEVSYWFFWYFYIKLLKLEVTELLVARFEEVGGMPFEFLL